MYNRKLARIFRRKFVFLKALLFCDLYIGCCTREGLVHVLRDVHGTDVSILLKLNLLGTRVSADTTALVNLV